MNIAITIIGTSYVGLAPVFCLEPCTLNLLT